MSALGKIDRKSVYADLALALVALFWGGGFVVLKDALDGMTPFYIMAIRFSLAFLIMAVVFHRRFRCITKRDLKAGALIGLFLFAGFATQTVGLQYTTAGKQAFLTAIYVVVVPFLTWMISKKHPGWHAVTGAVLSVIGIGLLTLEGTSLSIGWGDTLTLLCALFFAGHIVAVGYFASDTDPAILTVVQTGMAALIFIPCAIFFEPAPTAFNLDVAVAIGYQVIFCTVLAFFIQNTAQKYTPSTHAAIILALESVFGSILAVLFLGEVFTLTMVVGCVLIFAAIIITETRLSFFTGWRSRGKVVDSI